MADRFNPRGAPIPGPNPYDGWELSARNPFLPVGEYTNAAGDVSAGFAMPSMVSEPANALYRLVDTPAGTMPNPQNEDNQRDALTSLMSFYGGNAMSGMARGAASKAAPSSIKSAVEFDFNYPVHGGATSGRRNGFTDEPLLNPFPGHARPVIDSESGGMLWPYDITDRQIQRSQDVRSFPDLYSDTNKPSILGSSIASQGGDGIIAYHGSPHDFDKFDLSKIGTGEGAQAYGHGLYFAENEGVANWYRDKLSALSPTSKGRLGQSLVSDGVRKYGRDYRKIRDDVMQQKQAAAKRWGVSVDKAPLGGMYDEAISITDRAILDPDFNPIPGHMYQVRINADPNDFLDWDKPLSGQSEKVRAALSPFEQGYKDDFILRQKDLLERQKRDDAALGLSVDRQSSIEDLLRDFDQRATPDIALGSTDALRKAGIPGIKYLDGNSRSAGEGSHNYVVLDDSLIDILKKYGLLPAAYGASQMMQDDGYTTY